MFLVIRMLIEFFSKSEKKRKDVIFILSGEENNK